MPRSVALIAALFIAIMVVLVLAPVQSPKSRQLIQDRVMGTVCTLKTVGGDTDDLKAALAEISRQEARFSTWIQRSQVSVFNIANPESRFPLDDHLKAVLAVSKEAFTLSEGAFDPACGPAIMVWRNARRSGRMPSPHAIASARAVAGFEAVEWDDQQWWKTKPSVEVNFGGVAKGYAIDQAWELMNTESAKGLLVDIGGDLRVSGVDEDGEPWKVSVRNPFQTDAVFLTIQPGNAAVATSGNYERYAEIDGKRYSHIIDPRTAMPVDAVASVTVVAPTCAQADAWATALSVMGTKGLDKLPAGVEALMILGTGPADVQTVHSPGFGAFHAR